MDLGTCGELGGVLAADIIGHYGARPESDLKEVIKPVIG